MSRISVQGTITLDSSTWKQLDAYRAMRKCERGKTITTATAISELIDRSLSGIEPPKPLEDRLREIEGRLSLLEQWRVDE